MLNLKIYFFLFPTKSLNLVVKCNLNHNFGKKLLNMVRHCTYCIELNYNTNDTRVVDQDLVGSENFSQILIKSFQIRAAPDPKWIWNKTFQANW